MTIDWQYAPSWAMYHAFEANGVGYWYEYKPEPVNSHWKYTMQRQLSGYTQDWQSSCMERPLQTYTGVDRLQSIFTPGGKLDVARVATSSAFSTGAFLDPESFSEMRERLSGTTTITDDNEEYLHTLIKYGQVNLNFTKESSEPWNLLMFEKLASPLETAADIIHVLFDRLSAGLHYSKCLSISAEISAQEVVGANIGIQADAISVCVYTKNKAGAHVGWFSVSDYRHTDSLRVLRDVMDLILPDSIPITLTNANTLHARTLDAILNKAPCKISILR